MFITIFLIVFIAGIICQSSGLPELEEDLNGDNYYKRGGGDSNGGW